MVFVSTENFDNVEYWAISHELQLPHQPFLEWEDPVLPDDQEAVLNLLSGVWLFDPLPKVGDFCGEEVLAYHLLKKERKAGEQLEFL